MHTCKDKVLTIVNLPLRDSGTETDLRHCEVGLADHTLLRIVCLTHPQKPQRLVDTRRDGQVKMSCPTSST